MAKTGVMVVVSVVLAVAGIAATLGAQQGGPAKPPVSEQSGTITFDTQTGTVGADPERYEVPAGHQLELTLTLEVSGGGEAELASPPVRFPHGDPPQLRWRRKSPTEVVVIELNDNRAPGTEEEYYFKARVELGGEIHESPDPTLVHVGPPGDG